MTTSPTFLASSLLVAAGGALGAWLRYLAGLGWIAAIGPVRASAFPWATLSVNLAGSLAMGLLAGWLARHGPDSLGGGEGLRLLLGVGLLGGFTTFSALSLEFVLLVQRDAGLQAATYAALSLVLGIAGLFAGLAVMRAAP